MKHHRVEGIIDPKYGNWCRIEVIGEDLDKVLESFSKQVRLVAAHTEEELRAMVRKDPSLFSSTV